MNENHIIGRTEKVHMLRDILMEKRIVYLASFFYGGKTVLMEQLAARWSGEVLWFDLQSDDWQKV